jgi:hypothetical protein
MVEGRRKENQKRFKISRTISIGLNVYTQEARSVAVVSLSTLNSKYNVKCNTEELTGVDL